MPKLDHLMGAHPNASGVSLLPPNRPLKSTASGSSGHSATAKDSGGRPLEALSERSLQILAGLPSAFQMHETRKHFPHVLNRMTDAWHDPEFLHHVVRNLLIDQRGGRTGFPFSVLAEITNLREYYYNNVRPEAREKFDRHI
jgi:hypothetical protein